MNAKMKSYLFLTGIFLSSLGSTTFVIALMMFPAKMGISLAVVGTCIALSRIVNVAANFFLGPVADRKSPRQIIVVGELGAFVGGTLVYIFSKNLANDHYFLFLLSIAIRAFFMGLQSASVQKAAKQFDIERDGSGQFAKYLNKATFGSIFFAMLANLIILKYGSFQTAIIFDIFTFIANGLLAYFTLSNSHSPAQNHSKLEFSKIWRENKNYFAHRPALLKTDLVLAVAMTGANTLNVLLLSSHPDLIPIASGIFGLAVWLSTPAEKMFKLKDRTLWIVLAFSLLAQGFSVGQPIVLFFFSFFRNLSYWILYNHLSAKFMAESSDGTYGGVASGRQTLLNVVGGLGEIWVGLKYLVVRFECIWRGLLLSTQIRNRQLTALILILCMQRSYIAQGAPKELRIPIRSTEINTDPQLMEDVASLFINRQIYRGLFRYTPELDLVPDLVASYEVLDDGKRYIFLLGNHRFHDGSLVTAADVTSTFERMLKVKSGIVPDLKSIRGFNSNKLPIGVRAVAPDKVEFSLEYNDPFFLKTLAAVDCSILKLDKDLNFTTITNGRYKLEKKDKSLTLKLIESPKKNAAKKIELPEISSDEDAYNHAKLDRIDSLESYELGPLEIETLAKKGWQPFHGQVARVILASMNPKKLSSRSRKNIFIKMSESEYSGSSNKQYLRTFGVLPVLLPGHLRKEDLSTLVKKTSSLELPKKIEIRYAESREMSAIFDWVKKSLESTNTIVTARPFKIPDYFKVIKSHDYQIVLRSKFLDYPDGLSFLTYFKNGIEINTFNVGNPQIDKLIDSATAEITPKDRAELYKKIQIEALKEYTLLPLLTGSSQSMIWNTNKVVAVPSHPMGLHSLYLDEIELK